MDKIYVKHEHLFKSKLQMVIYMIIFVILLGLFIYLGSLDYKSDDILDNERFAQEFSLVSEDNVFKYATAVDARMVAGGTKGIVLFGTKNEWVDYYAYIINKVAKEVGIKEIYYYDFIKNRQDNNGTYEDIVNKLEDYVVYNDRGVGEIYAPSLMVVSNDKLLMFDSETSFVKGNITPSRYWTSEKQLEKENELRVIFTKYLEES